MAATVLNNKAMVSNTVAEKKGKTFTAKVKEYFLENIDIISAGILAMNGSYYRPMDKLRRF